MLNNNSYKNKVSEIVSWGHWFTFYNILLALALGCIYIINSPWPSSGIGVTYLATSWLGHFSSLIFIFYILILFPVSFIIPNQRLLRVFSSIYATLFISAIFLDALIYTYMHLHLNAIVWKLLVSGEEKNAQRIWNSLFIFIPVVFCLELWISARVWGRLRKITKRRIGRKIALFFFICAASSHLIYLLADVHLYRPVTMQRSNFPLAYPMTAKGFMEKHGWFDRDEYAKHLSELTGHNSLVNYPLQPLTFTDKGKKYNLLVIMVDSLRSDMLNTQNMPNLENFAKQNIRFTDHYSSGNDMLGGLFGLFYGLPATYIQNFRTDNKKPLLISTLKARNYQFGLFSGDDFSDLFYSRTVFDIEDLPKKAPSSPAVIDDKKALNHLNHWLTQVPKSPWFSYVELKAIEDYEKRDFPAEFPVETAPKDIEQASATLKARYKNAVYFDDKLLKSIFDSLDKQALLDNTIVVITSNHGMEFNETGTDSWGSNSNYSQYQIKVPLIIHWPGKDAEIISEKTSHMDIVPTLMESLLNTTSPAKTYSSGSNLFEVQPRSWLLAGDAKDIVVIEPDQTIVLDKFGNYNIFDKDYQLMKDEEAKISVLLQVMTELKRFNVQPHK